MMFDVKVLEKLVELARASDEVKVVRPESEPRPVYFLKENGEMLERREAEPRPRQHQAGDLTAIVRFALDFHAEQDVEIWYSRKGVVCYLDSATRRDKVGMLLEESPILRNLREAAGKQLPQKAFLRLLRVGLAGNAPQQLIDAVRHVKFQVNQAGESEIRHQKASIGRSIEAELRGADAIPEDVTLYLPAFEGDANLYGVYCAIEIEPAAQTLALTPLPGAIESVLRQAEADLGRSVLRLLRLERGHADDGSPYEETVGVFYGIP